MFRCGALEMVYRKPLISKMCWATNMFHQKTFSSSISLFLISQFSFGAGSRLSRGVDINLWRWIARDSYSDPPLMEMYPSSDPAASPTIRLIEMYLSSKWNSIQRDIRRRRRRTRFVTNVKRSTNLVCDVWSFMGQYIIYHRHAS